MYAISVNYAHVHTISNTTYNRQTIVDRVFYLHDQ